MNFAAIAKGVLAGAIALVVLRFCAFLALPVIMGGSVPVAEHVLVAALAGAGVIIFVLPGMITGYAVMRFDSTRSLINAAFAAALLGTAMVLWDVKSSYPWPAAVRALISIGCAAMLGVAGAFVRTFQTNWSKRSAK
jgi:hypothetical protein